MHTYARDTWLGLTIWTRDETELRVVVVAYKCTLALNTTLKVLPCGVLTKQTPPNTDSHSIVLWKATRYAMVRWGTTRLTIDFLTIIQADALMLTLEAKPPVLVELEHTVAQRLIQADSVMITLEAKPPVLVELEHTVAQRLVQADALIHSRNSSQSRRSHRCWSSWSTQSHSGPLRMDMS